MIGFAVGGVVMGRMADRFGIMLPALIGAVALSAGLCRRGQRRPACGSSRWRTALLIALLGGAATFGPIVADISHWFSRRRGIAVAIAASGNYLAGAIWPPLVQHFIADRRLAADPCRIGVVCAVTMIPLALTLRRRPPAHAPGRHARRTGARPRSACRPPRCRSLLAVAGFCCCVAMSMPQVHIVAYCGDLGYGVARGAEMLSLMLGLGIISRVGSGFVADRIGGLPTLLLGSIGQMLALLLYLGFSGLASLYAISALFGLVQGGIVPSYAIVIREYLPAREAGMRFGVVIMATLLGMAFGGWISGVIFDLTGSYRAAFANGASWNLLNAGIAVALLLRRARGRLIPPRSATPVAADRRAAARWRRRRRSGRGRARWRAWRTRAPGARAARPARSPDRRPRA